MNNKLEELKQKLTPGEWENYQREAAKGNKIMTNPTYVTPGDHILYDFIWGETEEGDEYWENLYHTVVLSR